MKKEVPPALAIVVIVIAVLVAGFFLWRAYRGGKSEQVSDIGSQVNVVIQKIGGDLSKATPEDRAVLERAIKERYPLPPGLEAQLRAGSEGVPASGTTSAVPDAR
jgi:hypothetical protein